MKRILILAAVLLTATTAQAGPIRDRIAARFARPCQPCQPCQTVQVPAVSHTPVTHAPAVQFQPVRTVAAYQPAGFSPLVRTCSGGVCK